jgi:hypothetical protein
MNISPGNSSARSLRIVGPGNEEASHRFAGTLQCHLDRSVGQCTGLIKDGDRGELFESGARRGVEDVLHGVLEVCMLVASHVLEKGWWVFIRTSTESAILFD